MRIFRVKFFQWGKNIFLITLNRGEGGGGAGGRRRSGMESKTPNLGSFFSTSAVFITINSHAYLAENTITNETQFLWHANYKVTWTCAIFLISADVDGVYCPVQPGGYCPVQLFSFLRRMFLEKLCFRKMKKFCLEDRNPYSQMFIVSYLYSAY